MKYKLRRVRLGGDENGPKRQFICYFLFFLTNMFFFYNQTTFTSKNGDDDERPHIKMAATDITTRPTTSPR